jgi:hypothetical protein
MKTSLRYFLFLRQSAAPACLAHSILALSPAMEQAQLLAQPPPCPQPQQHQLQVLRGRGQLHCSLVALLLGTG